MKNYKHTFLLFTIFLGIVSCSNENSRIQIDEKTGNPMLVGLTDLSAFEDANFSDWYSMEYNAYEADNFILDQIKLFQDSVNIEIFMGTWCGDSRREVPRFIKILDSLNYNKNNLKIVNLDRSKKSPRKLEKNKSIEFIPTFIFKKHGAEIGRIVEYPIVTLESDMLEIILKNQ